MISHKGKQFVSKTFRRWWRRRGIRQRFGAVGKYGSIAVVERLVRTIKSECTRRFIVVPLRQTALEREPALWRGWYNASRPHEWLATRTPDEIYFGIRPACKAPRFEPRPRWPRQSPCAAPHALIRGRPGATVEMTIHFHEGRQHLPVISLHRAA